MTRAKWCEGRSFWAAGEFDELEDLTPGDVLVTPDGRSPAHNYDAFPEDNPTFIPDGVRGTDPPQFIEIKDYQATILRPGTNAGAQINYLMAWARDNPGGGTPSFELWISNPSNLSPQFRRLLTEAQDANVEIMVNGATWVPPPP